MWIVFLVGIVVFHLNSGCANKNSDSQGGKTQGDVVNPEDVNKIPDDLFNKTIPSGPALNQSQKEYFIKFMSEIRGSNDLPEVDDLIFPEMTEEDKQQKLNDRKDDSNEKIDYIKVLEHNCLLKQEQSGIDFYKLPSDKLKVGEEYAINTAKSVTGESICPVSYKERIVENVRLQEWDKDEKIGKDIKEIKRNNIYTFDYNFITKDFQQLAKVYRVTSTSKTMSLFRYGYNKTPSHDNGYSFISESYFTASAVSEFFTLNYGNVKANSTWEWLSKKISDNSNIQKTFSVSRIEVGQVLYVFVSTELEELDKDGKQISKISKVYLNGEELSKPN
jgi:hypothetical protein